MPIIDVKNSTFPVIAKPYIPIKVQRITKDAKVPTKNFESDMGWDIYIIPDDGWKKYNGTGLFYELAPEEKYIFRTGIKVSTPDNYGFLVRDRSGFGARRGLHILAGVIEGTYRGEWHVCAVNLGDVSIILKPNDRIAQAILTKIIPASIIEVDELPKSERGEEGFGSSGQ